VTIRNVLKLFSVLSNARFVYFLKGFRIYIFFDSHVFSQFHELFCVPFQESGSVMGFHYAYADVAVRNRPTEGLRVGCVNCSYERIYFHRYLCRY
jgi:hypothetical protein